MKPVIVALALSLTGLPALAQGASPAEAVTKANAAAPPNASDLLFEQPQLRNAAPGTRLTYGYIRRSGISSGPFGPPMDDRIRLTIEPGATAQNRNVSVEMFSGANRFPAGPFEDMPGNPAMTLFLEHHLVDLSKVLLANPRYLKNAIRKSLRDNATVTATKVEVKGEMVDAWRVEAKPFVDDKMKERMRGLSNLTYTFVTSAAVPGELISIEAQSKTEAGGELLQESLTYDPTAG